MLVVVVPSLLLTQLQFFHTLTLTPATTISQQFTQLQLLLLHHQHHQHRLLSTMVMDFHQLTNTNCIKKVPSNEIEHYFQKEIAK